MISELAAVVNDRPLTYASEDPNELTDAAHAVPLPRGAPRRPPLCTVMSLDKASPRSLRDDLLYRTIYFRSLASRWKREYLTQLRSANRTAGSDSPVIKIGDVESGSWSASKTLTSDVTAISGC